MLQLNTSRADFSKKLHKLKLTINRMKSQMILVSESKAEINDDNKIEEISKCFQYSKFEEKIIMDYNDP